MPKWSKVCGHGKGPVAITRAQRRFRARRKVLAGYPWMGRFGTKEEFDAYFEGDRITCLLCGKPYKRLSLHLPKIHGVTEDEYRERYGLPYRRGLTCEASAEQYSRAMKKRLEDPEEMAKLMDHVMDPEVIAKRNAGSRNQRTSAYKRSTSLKNSLSRVGRDVEVDTELICEVFDKMVEHDMLLREVLELYPEFPKLTTVYGKMRRSNVLSDKYKDTLDKLSFPTQARGEQLQKRFTDTVKKMYAEGLNQYEIAEILGVHVMSVNRHINL